MIFRIGQSQQRLLFLDHFEYFGVEEESVNDGTVLEQSDKWYAHQSDRYVQNYSFPSKTGVQVLNNNTKNVQVETDTHLKSQAYDEKERQS